MSEEQLKAFVEKVKADTSLQEKLKAAADADAVLAIAKEAGFMISAEDLKDFKNAQFSEISDEELEGAAAAGGGGAAEDAAAAVPAHKWVSAGFPKGFCWTAGRYMLGPNLCF